MTHIDAQACEFDTDGELRRRNRAVVADYMSRKGESRLTRSVETRS